MILFQTVLFSSETGMDDTVKLNEWRTDYEVITIWITKMKKAFAPDQDPPQDLDFDKDLEEIKKSGQEDDER